ncbi:MAG: glycosyltransferase family 9 protein [Syntrophaceae bacterium]|nr:glycosyltransferase family 9 protein [Syntrophaceae bacterium]
MKSPKNVLLIIRRSLGDVLAISPVIDILSRRFSKVSIDLLINEDTMAAAKLLNGTNNIIPFDNNLLTRSTMGSIAMQIRLIRKIFRQYDLAISFTSNERSNIFAYLAGRISVGTRELSFSKNWWHRLLLDVGYYNNRKRHILENNVEALRQLNINIDRIVLSAHYSDKTKQKVQQMLKDLGIDRFIIFHPTGKFLCRLYPGKPRNILLQLLDSLDIPIIVTGGKSTIDQQVAAEMPTLKNVYSMIGKISLEECAALTDMSMAFVGVDTFNCHLAAAFNKPIFVLFGPNIPETWSPWSNALQRAGQRATPVQTYGDITLFQSSLECVPCGHSARCGGQDRLSPCMADIDPHIVFNEVKNWLSKALSESMEDAKKTILPT